MWEEEKGRNVWEKPAGKGNQLYCSLGDKAGDLNWFQESRGLERVSSVQDVVKYLAVMVLLENYVHKFFNTSLFKRLSFVPFPLSED